MLPRPTAEPIAAKMKAVRPEKAPRFARRVAPGGGGWVDALKVRLRGRAVGRQLGVTTARWGTRGGGEGQGGAAEGFCAGSDRWWGPPSGSRRGEGCSRRHECPEPRGRRGLRAALPCDVTAPAAGSDTPGGAGVKSPRGPGAHIAGTAGVRRGPRGSLARRAALSPGSAAGVSGAVAPHALPRPAIGRAASCLAAVVGRVGLARSR